MNGVSAFRAELVKPEMAPPPPDENYNTGIVAGFRN